MMRTNNRCAHRAGPYAAVATLVMSFAVAFLALSSASADATTTTAAPATSVPSFVSSVQAAIISPNTHGPYTLTSDECATCHRAHTGKDHSILPSPDPQSTLCFTCHDGTGALTNVKATYTDPAVPQNVVSDRRIYRHDTLEPTTHTSARNNEFGGVSNRHSECSDCHNSHKANGTDSVPTLTGFTNSGRLAGISGVSVVNHAAGTLPTYTFLPGNALLPLPSITREYQLCFKCHSGFTTLDSNAGFVPSRFRTDKGVEFNPNNPSFHPVEAKGTNTTTAMGLSLAGPSPYKQWNLTKTSVISCANCHSNYQRYNQANPPSLNASSPLHASNTAGILRQPYRNRSVKPAGQAYSAAEFALCYMCHSNVPMEDGGSPATNFDKHAAHLTSLNSSGGEGGTLDTPGAGKGNAICAECHFRQHSTTYKSATPVQDISGTRLVSFAPNVSDDSNGDLSWVPDPDGQGGSCTLTCHGKDHTGKGY